MLSKFQQLMDRGNGNGTLRLLTNNMSNVILPLSDENLQLLHLKHPEHQEAHNEVLLQGSIKQVHSIVYDDIVQSTGNEGSYKDNMAAMAMAFDASY